MLSNPGAKKAWANAVCETHPGKVCPAALDPMCFFWLHPNQMVLEICAGACPFSAGTTSYVFGHAGTEPPTCLAPCRFGMSVSSCMETWHSCGSTSPLLLTNCSVCSVFDPVPCFLPASSSSSFRPPLLSCTISIVS